MLKTELDREISGLQKFVTVMTCSIAKALLITCQESKRAEATSGGLFYEDRFQKTQQPTTKRPNLVNRERAVPLTQQSAAVASPKKNVSSEVSSKFHPDLLFVSGIFSFLPRQKLKIS